MKTGSRYPARSGGVAIEDVFVPFPKIARLNRPCLVTEKIDGTNAAIGFDEVGNVWAQSRSRVITPEADNFGFARWVHANDEELFQLLGEGLHFGEWWGQGIQRNYGMKTKAFSLFNVKRWRDLNELDGRLTCVPVLGEEELFDTGIINSYIGALWQFGSEAAPGFMKPEGIVVQHVQSRLLFKVTLEKDEQPKGRDNA